MAATFFGEVTELSSRAVWWSESEDENEAEDPSKGRPIFQSEVLNPQLVDTFEAQCKIIKIFLCTQYRPLPNAICLLRLKLEGKEDNPKDDIASLYQVDSTNYWLVINDKKIQKIYTVRFVDYVAEHILKRIKSKFELMLISKELTNFDYVQYLSNNSTSNATKYLLEYQKTVDMKPFLSPETVKNDLELAILEYCIVKKINFVCIQLPSAFSDALTFIPKQLMDSISEFSNLSFSNIIT